MKSVRKRLGGWFKVDGIRLRLGVGGLISKTIAPYLDTDVTDYTVMALQRSTTQDLLDRIAPVRLEKRSTGLAGLETRFGWPDASPNTLIARGK